MAGDPQKWGVRRGFGTDAACHYCTAWWQPLKRSCWSYFDRWHAANNLLVLSLSVNSRFSALSFSEDPPAAEWMLLRHFRGLLETNRTRKTKWMNEWMNESLDAQSHHAMLHTLKMWKLLSHDSAADGEDVKWRSLVKSRKSCSIEYLLHRE